MLTGTLPSAAGILATGLNFVDARNVSSQTLAVMTDLPALFASARTIAVVGCSNRPDRISNSIARYLQEAGYRIIPVNPEYDEILGARCYPNLASIPADAALDIVNVFRRPAHTAGVVREVVERSARTGEKPVVWTQPGVSSPEAEKEAVAAGLEYIRDRCIYTDHRRMARAL